MSKPHFRVGVVTVVRRDDGEILAFERVDAPGSWQLPQGGVEHNETFEHAAWRELEEETGLTNREVALVDEHPEWTAYVWPVSMHHGDRLGQAHRWYFFEPIVEPIEPTPDGEEFSNWCWMRPEALISTVVDFRRQPYEQVLGRPDE